VQIQEQTQLLEDKISQMKAQQEALAEKIRLQEEKQEEYQQILEKNGEKQTYLVKLSSDCEQLEQEIEEQKKLVLEPLLARQKELKESQQQQKAQILEAKEKVKEQEKQAVPLQETLKKQQEKQKEAQEAQQALTSQIEETNRVISDRADAVNQLKEQYEEKQETVLVLRKKQNELNGDVVMLQNEIDRLKDHLNNEDIENLKREQQSLMMEKIQYDEQMETLRSSVEEEQKELKEKRDALQAQRDAYEKEKSLLTDECTRHRNRIQELQDLIQKGENQKKESTAKAASLEEECRQMRLWFESLDAEAAKKRLSLLEKKLQVYQKVQKELFYESDTLDIHYSVSSQEANEKREELRSRLKELEQLFETYKNIYNRVCDLLKN
jgi:hypothetical protein